MYWPSRQDWLFALVTFAAAVLALYIAFAADLDRPYWAAGTVYIVSQRTTGALRAKALWRLVGTLCGASMAVLVIPVLVNAPPLLILVMSMWISACLAGSLLVGGLRGYAFMLAGYTAAIIGFPALDQPGDIWSIAVSRVEEISLGIVCTHVLHTIFLARSINPALHAAVNRWMRDLVGLAEVMLVRTDRRYPALADWRRLATHVGALDRIFDQARYERADPRLLSDMRILRGQARRCSLLMTSVAMRLVNLRESAPALHAQAESLVGEIGRWLVASMPEGRPVALAVPAELLRKLEAGLEEASPHDRWSVLVYTGLCERGHELVLRWKDCLDLARGAPASLHLPPAPRRPQGLVDPLLVALSCLSVAVSLVGVCIFWRWAAWPSGSSAAMMATIAGSIFAHMDDPAPAIGSFFVGNALAVLVAAAYLFGILPAIDGFPLLIYWLAIFFIPATAFLGHARIAPWLTPLVIGTFPSMSLQEVSSANFALFANNSIASLFGIASVLAATQIMRSVTVRQRIERLIRADRRDLAQIASGRKLVEHDEILDRMLDRFEAVAIRIGGESGNAAEGPVLGDLRAALNVLGLQRHAPALDERHATLVGSVLDDVAEYAVGLRPPADMLASLDQAAVSGSPWRTPDERAVALDLAGLRLALFPQDPPPQSAAQAG